MDGVVLSPMSADTMRRRSDASGATSRTSQRQMLNKGPESPSSPSEDSGARVQSRSGFITPPASIWNAAVSTLREKSSSMRLSFTAVVQQKKTAAAPTPPLLSPGAVPLRPTMSADTPPSDGRLTGLKLDLERVDEDSPTSNPLNSSDDNSISWDLSHFKSPVSIIRCTRRASSSDKGLEAPGSSPTSTPRSARQMGKPQQAQVLPRQAGPMALTSPSSVQTTVKAAVSASAVTVTRAISCPLEKVGFLAKNSPLKEKVD